MASSQDEIYPFFPSRTDNDIDFFSQQDNFNCFIKESVIYLLSLEGDEIVYNKAENVADVKQIEIYKEHLRHHLRKQIFGSPVKPEIKTFSDFIHNFQANQSKMKIFCRCEKKPNVNNKTFYYLVKKYFTEGVQYVGQGETHTYKAIGKPLYIYISNTPLKLKSFRTTYEGFEKIIIESGSKEIIPSKTYYFVIARCHTFFKLEISTPEVENSTSISLPLETEGDPPVTEEDRITVSPPLGSRNDTRGNARLSLEFGRPEDPQMISDNASISIRPSTENNRQSNQATSSTHEPRESTSRMKSALDLSLRNEKEIMSKTGSSRAVFAIRKGNNIEPYTLRPGSTFCILQGNTITGSFEIGNDDMDPCVIEYRGDKQFIEEVAKFRNGSKLVTKLPVQRGLLKELRDPARKEKVVVSYFFEFAFRSIEEAYKNFLEMRHLRMIGSCVPAIVLLSDARFIGTVSEDYETKPSRPGCDTSEQ